METTGLVFLNNKIMSRNEAAISIMDQSVQFGCGLFETIKVHNGSPVLIDEHLNRIFSSSLKFKIKINTNKIDLADSVYKFIKAVGTDNFVLKIVFAKGDEAISNIFFTYRDNPYHSEDYKKGFTAKVTSIKRNESSPLVYMKTLNYMENMLAKQEVKENGYDEAIFVNTKGFLSEGSLSNLFFVKNQKLYTPKVECGLLPGVVRNFLIEKIAPSLGFEVYEGEYSLNQLLEAEEAFLTNSVMEVMSLSKVNEVTIGDGVTRNITNRIAALYKRICI